MKQTLEEILDLIGERLALIADIKKFCVEELGFNKNKSFTKIINQEAIYVLYASPKYSIESALDNNNFNWTYNNKRDRDEKAKLLREKGLDVYTVSWEASAEIPQITPGVLNATESRLIYLIIHENVHIYLRNKKIKVNKDLPLDIEEPIADNIAYKGALMYYSENKSMINKIKKNKIENDEYDLEFNYYLNALNHAYQTKPESGREILLEAQKFSRTQEINNAFFYHGSFYTNNTSQIDKILENISVKECLNKLSTITKINNIVEFENLFKS